MHAPTKYKTNEEVVGVYITVYVFWVDWNASYFSNIKSNICPTGKSSQYLDNMIKYFMMCNSFE